MVVISRAEAEVVLELCHSFLESEVYPEYANCDTRELSLLPDEAFGGMVDMEEVNAIKDLCQVVLKQMEDKYGK